MPRRQCYDLFGSLGEEFAGAHNERACSLLRQFRERRVDLAFGAGIYEMDFQPQCVCRCAHIARLHLGSRVVRVQKQSDDRGCGYHIVQQSQPFRHQLGTQLGHTGDVMARPVQGRRQAEPERVTRGLEDDRNDSGGGFGRECRRRAGRCDNGHLSADQIGRHTRQSIVSALGPPVFDLDVMVFDVPSLTQALPECSRRCCLRLGRATVHEPEYRHRRLLRARCERPRGRRAELHDELAPLHRHDPNSNDHSDYSRSGRCIAAKAARS